MTAPWAVAYSFGDRGELRELATNNGFENAFVRFDVKIARHPDPHKFVAGAIAGSPLADAFENANDETQKTILQEIVRGLDKCMDDGGLAYPAECHTLTARIP